MNSQSEKVRQYFDSIARDYSSRFTPSSPFHAYFFGERLRLATQDFDFDGKNILDIGAGTGALYDYLKSTYRNLRYYATDISPAMLAQSNIPSHFRFVGRAFEITFPEKDFDYIFLLGVTPYMSKIELDKTIQFIDNQLSANGFVVMSFANRASIDFLVRKFLGFFLKKSGWKKGVLAQDFDVRFLKLKEVNRIMGANLIINKTVFFNHTFTPFSRCFPKFSVWLSKWIHGHIKNPKLKSRLSADFMVFFEKRNPSEP